MRVEIKGSHAPGRKDLILAGIRYSSFSEHDLRDLEFVLAQQRAMTSRCDEENGEHTCGLAPQHKDAKVVIHLCRACDAIWDPGGPVRRPGARVTG